MKNRGKEKQVARQRAEHIASIKRKIASAAAPLHREVAKALETPHADAAIGRVYDARMRVTEAGIAFTGHASADAAEELSEAALAYAAAERALGDFGEEVAEQVKRGELDEPETPTH